MSWRQSLIKLADLDVEMLRKRLVEIAEREAVIALVLDALDEEAAAETARAATDAEAGWYLVGFRLGWTQRRAKAQGDLKACRMEAQGARDALGHAFETQKKYERLAETARVAAVKETARRDGLALDELALRRTATW